MIYILFIFLGVSVTQAKDQTFVDFFSSQSLVIPETLKKNNVDKIEDLKIDGLINEIKSVFWRANHGSFLLGSGETRTSAIYFIKDKTVVVNSLRSQFEPKLTLPISALHEALGALGYKDENYEMSILLYLNTLSQAEQGRFLPKNFVSKNNKVYFSNIIKRYENTTYQMAKGGGTSVGGGGDGLSVQIKLTALLFAQVLCSKIEINCSGDIHHLLLKSPIEINPNIKIDHVTVTESEKPLIRVPFLKWLNGNFRTKETSLSTEQFQILSEILLKVNGD
ncbi:MAG TPA: hypothetical protein PLJ21_02150 [Pseudobdellovibrionaceae bacterium]|nr:hypothetical protein [Pseudobdellovibrionaceae bacterium]